MTEACAIYGCHVHRTKDTYARPTIKGRSHATKHHLVAERFFGRSRNHRGQIRQGIFDSCPWHLERPSEIFCYECHEELVHNPVLLSDDIAKLAALVRSRELSEEIKSEDRSKIAGRVKLFHEVISRGISALHTEEIESRRS